MIPSYELTKDSATDLEGIVRYTLLKWGTEQARLYLDNLHQCFQRIADTKAEGKTFSERFPSVRVTRCEHHYVFYLHPDGHPPRIFAVFHERMDLLTRLKHRLP